MESPLISTLSFVAIMLAVAIVGAWDSAKERHRHSRREDDTE